MPTAFIIIGECGEYDDHVTWPVRAFTDRPDADDFCRWCNAEATRLKNTISAARTTFQDQWFSDLKPGDNPLDPHMRADFGRTTYHVEAVPLGMPV